MHRVCNELRGTVHGLLSNRTDQVTYTPLVIASPLTWMRDGLRMSATDRRCRDGYERRSYRAWFEESRATSSWAAISFIVGEMACGSPD
jgi:hypothetical protein